MVFSYASFGYRTFRPDGRNVDACDGNLKLSPGSKSKPDEGYRSRFSHDEESASPGYYKVRLKDYDIMAELTVSPRCGFHRYTFPESESSHIILDLSHHFATDSVLLLL